MRGLQLERGFMFQRESINEETRTCELAFSSEAPYQRWWGVEILDHSAEAIDLTRLKSGGPVLCDHDTRDQVGVIESVRIDADRVGRAVVRFGRSARAEEIFRDVVDGIRKNVSVGYSIDDLVLEAKSGDEETYRVTRWTRTKSRWSACRPTFPSASVAQPNPRLLPLPHRRNRKWKTSKSSTPARSPAMPARPSRSALAPSSPSASSSTSATWPNPPCAAASRSTSSAPT